MDQFEWVYQFLTHSQLSRFVVFPVYVALSILIGRYTASLMHLFSLVLPCRKRRELYQYWIKTMRLQFNRIGTWILLYFALRWLHQHESSANWLKFLIDLFTAVFAVWLTSFLFKQFVNFYGISLLKKLGGDETEILLAVNTIFSMAIGLIALLILISRYGVRTNDLLAGVSLIGIAFTFTAQGTLQQLFGTVILLLDKPCIRGEYIRLQDGTFGRVESIGLRSTKIRTAAKNTLVIVPNSQMVDSKIENVTRGKKVMILVYFDFKQLLNEYEKSLVIQTINNYIHTFLSVEPNTSNITFLSYPDREFSRARITFFILGSTESSIELRKQIVRLAETQISQELAAHGISYSADEPVISFESPVTL